MYYILTKRWVQLILLLLLLSAAVALRLQDPSGIERLRFLTFDYYNKLLPRKPHNDVLIVDIDEESIRRHGQWPWPRTLVGDLPQVLTEMGAKAVIFDIVFSESDRTSPERLAERLPADMKDVAEALKKIPNNDTIFAQKIAQAGNVVMGFSAANQATAHQPEAKARILNEGLKPDATKFVYARDNFTVPLPVISQAAAGNGSFTMFPEVDGIIRRVPLFIGQRDEAGKVDQIFPSLSLEALRIAEKKKIYSIKSYAEGSTQGYGITDVKVGSHSIPTDISGSIWVYYAGHRPDLYVPAWQVLSRELDAEKIRDKIVFIGTSAIGLLDLRSSPLNPVLPGVEVHAEIVEQVLHKQFLQRPDYLDGAELIVTVIVGLFIIFISPFIGTGTLALLGGLLIAAGAFGGVYAYQNFGLVLDPVYPILAILTIFIVSSVLTNLRSETERRAVRQAFGQYLSPVLIEELADNPDKLKLGGETREISVVFTDIRNFTTISEGMAPEDLTNMMSDFLSPMTSCVLDNRGTVDKYMGDAMMAFWNAPLDDPDHTQNACIAALAMQASLEPVNENLEARAQKTGKPFHRLRAGIGIHTGEASVGNMGSKQRFAYSALGDTVNLASRLEGQTKGYGVTVMISEKAQQSITHFATLEIDLLTVKGRTESERVFTLLGDAEMAKTEAFKNLKQSHDAMLAAYRAQQWDKALALCAECSTKNAEIKELYTLYKARIEDFKNNPPPADWQGVWIALEK